MIVRALLRHREGGASQVREPIAARRFLSGRCCSSAIPLLEVRLLARCSAVSPERCVLCHAPYRRVASLGCGPACVPYDWSCFRRVSGRGLHSRHPELQHLSWPQPSCGNASRQRAYVGFRLDFVVTNSFTPRSTSDRPLPLVGDRACLRSRLRSFVPFLSLLSTRAARVATSELVADEDAVMLRASALTRLQGRTRATARGGGHTACLGVG